MFPFGHLEHGNFMATFYSNFILVYAFHRHKTIMRFISVDLAYYLKLTINFVNHDLWFMCFVILHFVQ